MAQEEDQRTIAALRQRIVQQDAELATLGLDGSRAEAGPSFDRNTSIARLSIGRGGAQLSTVRSMRRSAEPMMMQKQASVRRAESVPRAYAAAPAPPDDLRVAGMSYPQLGAF